MEEIWKDIARYEGLYQASSKGRIRSLSHYARNNPNGGQRLITGRILTPYKIPSGYLIVKLSKGEKREKISVHRLVALAFIDNRYNLPEVNHIDGDKTNNNIENLEWVTHKENQNHMYDSRLNKKAKPVECIEDGTTYRSIMEATRIKHISKRTIRMACISGKPCKGTHWRFCDDR